MFATFLIGLREGLEAALVAGILVAYLRQLGRKDAVWRMLAGVALAIVLALGLGAILTFGAYGLSFQAQEILGGTLSLLAVAMVTWMIFWMRRAGRTMKNTLESGVDRALENGTVWALIAIGFVSVAREGLETTLLLWSMVQSFGRTPLSLTGAVIGLVTAAIVGWFIARGAVRLNLAKFFTWTGGFLVIVAAGVLAYALHDLQEAGVIPGPPPAAIDGVTVVGWAAFPFGWAFDVSAVIPPTSTVAALLQAVVGFTPQMSWIQVIAWALYIVIVGFMFWRGVRRPQRSTPATSPSQQGVPA
ncbi:iron transporter [Microbacterium sorbitolivorans]|uniref:High-affinity Fe2+/Pb2+ permease n=1 Tax=Microbacterium sorbitolivorans TaxID=1867410 RepID=A0A367XYI5_9MICO|nr:iron uptake transporter permease EfeU [Microbacterium sorbitolivorans]RCK58459.1 high-affinity Fe2+/Pb2+ permease [Microbacterium sorbitolivorans]GGF36702.1 iron transporter [Microbacterium sorbitolivorans]